MQKLMCIPTPVFQTLRHDNLVCSRAHQLVPLALMLDHGATILRARPSIDRHGMSRSTVTAAETARPSATLIPPKICTWRTGSFTLSRHALHLVRFPQPDSQHKASSRSPTGSGKPGFVFPALRAHGPPFGLSELTLARSDGPRVAK
eukprot:scaffold60593_cov32-Tisochrysis_lutea.AAC.2